MGKILNLKDSNDEHKIRHSYYSNPTEAEAIASLIMEEREKEKAWKLELDRTLLKDMKAVLKRAKEMNCETVNFYHIPVKNVELVIEALQNYKKAK